MRLYGSERLISVFESLGVDEDTPIEHKMLTGALEQAQKTVESRNFQARKSTLEFDDVMNVQRNLIYEQRRKVLDGEDIRENIQGMVRDTIAETVGNIPPENADDLAERVAPRTRLFVRPGEIVYHDGMTVEELNETLAAIAADVYARREEAFGPMPDGTPLMRELERVVMLRVVDEYWMDHIDAMDNLRRGIGLRGYGNVKPIDAYKKEGFDMFEAMISGIRSEVVRRIYTVRVRKEERVERKSVTKNAVANAGATPPCASSRSKRSKARPERPLPVRQAPPERSADEVQGLLRQKFIRLCIINYLIFKYAEEKPLSHGFAVPAPLLGGAKMVLQPHSLPQREVKHVLRSPACLPSSGEVAKPKVLTEGFSRTPRKGISYGIFTLRKRQYPVGHVGRARHEAPLLAAARRRRGISRSAQSPIPSGRARAGRSACARSGSASGRRRSFPPRAFASRGRCTALCCAM